MRGRRGFGHPDARDQRAGQQVPERVEGDRDGSGQCLDEQTARTRAGDADDGLGGGDARVGVDQRGVVDHEGQEGEVRQGVEHGQRPDQGGRDDQHRHREPTADRQGAHRDQEQAAAEVGADHQRSPPHAVDEHAQREREHEVRRQEGGPDEGQLGGGGSQRDHGEHGERQLADLRTEGGERPRAPDAPERRDVPRVRNRRHAYTGYERTVITAMAVTLEACPRPLPSRPLRASSRSCARSSTPSTSSRERTGCAIRPHGPRGRASTGSTLARPPPTCASAGVFARHCARHCSPTTTARRSRPRPSRPSTPRRTARGSPCASPPTARPCDPTGTGVDAVYGRIVSAVAAALVDGTWSRLKACAADDCQLGLLRHVPLTHGPVVLDEHLRQPREASTLAEPRALTPHRACRSPRTDASGRCHAVSCLSHPTTRRPPRQTSWRVTTFRRRTTSYERRTRHERTSTRRSSAP